MMTASVVTVSARAVCHRLCRNEASMMTLTVVVRRFRAHLRSVGLRGPPLDPDRPGDEAATDAVVAESFVAKNQPYFTH
jgi:hypothetical protein